MAKRKAQEQETVVEETVVRHIHVKEWEPHANESLRTIEATIDSWGRTGSTVTVPTRRLDHAYVETQVDKLTKRVKGSRKVVVQETVTEWVERPASTVQVDDVVHSGRPSSADGPGWSPDQVGASAQVGALKHVEKDKKRRGFFGRRKEKAAAQPAASPADKDYQPQCAALTEDGAQCRNSARHDSKYCISHFGYQPPTVKGLAQRIEGDAWDPKDKVTDHESVRGADTRPVVRRARDTKVSVRRRPKAAARKSGRRKKR